MEDVLDGDGQFVSGRDDATALVEADAPTSTRLGAGPARADDDNDIALGSGEIVAGEGGEVEEVHPQDVMANRTHDVGAHSSFPFDQGIDEEDEELLPEEAEEEGVDEDEQHTGEHTLASRTLGATGIVATSGVLHPSAPSRIEPRTNAGLQNLVAASRRCPALPPKGPAAIASRLQCALLEEALAELGLRGASSPASWCRALGFVGVPSVQAREVFEILDVDRTGTVAPAAFCEADLSQEAMAGALQSSLDLVDFIHLRYRLLLIGCGACLGLCVDDTIGPAELSAACSRLQLVVNEADASGVLREMLTRGGTTRQGLPSLAFARLPPGPQHSSGSMGCGLSLRVWTLCHQLASWSTSAPKLLSWALTLERPGPFRVLGGHGGPPPPPAYVGKTPVEIIVQYKDPSTFPWHRLPESTSCRRFEELWRLARQITPGVLQARHRAAEEAVRLLVDPAWDPGRHCSYAPARRGAALPRPAGLAWSPGAAAVRAAFASPTPDATAHADAAAAPQPTSSPPGVRAAAPGAVMPPT